MRIIIDIAHPGHVHFFKNFIWEMQKRNHEILITAGDKDVTINLLTNLGFDYTFTCKRTSGHKLVLEIMKRDMQMFSIVKSYKPDIVMGIASTIAAHISMVTNTKSVVFTDTEHTKLADMITYPFSDVIVTPSCYMKHLRGKHVKYNGYHELAYLHPNYFTPNPEVLNELGLDLSDDFFLVRFSAFNASHDTNTENFDKRYISDLITKLENKGTVIIFSEVKLEPYLKKYQCNISPEMYHDLLYFSKMYIGEGSTTAIEAAVLGVPSLHFERLNINGEKSTILPYIGVLNELQTKYGLLYSFCDENDLLYKVDEILADLDRTKMIWNQRRDTLLNDKIDVTEFMVGFIENYMKNIN